MAAPYLRANVSVLSHDTKFARTLYNSLTRDFIIDVLAERNIVIAQNNTGNISSIFIDRLVAADKVDPTWINNLTTALKIIGDALLNKWLITGEILAYLNNLSLLQLKILALRLNFRVPHQQGGDIDEDAVRSYLKLLLLAHNPTAMPRSPENMVLFNDLSQFHLANLTYFIMRRHLLHSLITSDHADHVDYGVITRDELINIIITRDGRVMPKDMVTRTARMKYLMNNVHLQDLYEFLYPNELLLLDYALKPIHPMEAIITQYFRNVSDFGVKTYNMRLVELLGIELYPYKQEDTAYVAQVLVDNLPYYAHILTRGNLPAYSLEQLATLSERGIVGYLSKLSDKELIDICGTFIPYTLRNRNERVVYIAYAIKNPTFILPWYKRAATINTRRSSNSETISGTEITDTSTPMICYGTLSRFTTYELEDLLGAFHTDDVTGIMAFRHPDNYKLRFTLGEIKLLKTSALFYLKTETARNAAIALKLYDRIAVVKSYMNNIDNYLKELRLEMTPLSAADKKLLADFLHLLFYTGMYMRRWRGPGNAMPFTIHETKCSFDPEPLTRENLRQGVDILNAMSKDAKAFLLKLRIVDYNEQNALEIGSAEFIEQWNGVLEGNKCIRVASSKFIATCVFYLEKLFQETVPEMTGKKIELIQ